MFQLSAQQRYYMYREATDMRKGFNGLSGLVRNELEGDPLDGSAYVFVNRRRNRMKILVWETGGFVLYYKMLEQGTFELPAIQDTCLSIQLSWQQLILITQGVRLASIQQRKRFLIQKT